MDKSSVKSSNTGEMIKLVFKWMEEKGLENVRFTNTVGNSTVSYETKPTIYMGSFDIASGNIKAQLPAEPLSDEEILSILSHQDQKLTSKTISK